MAIFLTKMLQILKYIALVTSRHEQEEGMTLLNNINYLLSGVFLEPLEA